RAIIRARQIGRLTSQAYKNLVALNLHFMRSRRIGRGQSASGAWSIIEFRPMPGASNGMRRRINRDLAEWATVMRADVVERVDMTRGANQHNQSLANFNKQGARVGYLLHFGGSYVFA